MLANLDQVTIVLAAAPYRQMIQASSMVALVIASVFLVAVEEAAAVWELVVVRSVEVYGPHQMLLG
eukprot:CAMPEP_0172747062 /NCGR_PEP_ID=MMETSP1074-20121228/141948_1 /TAXON_ID=2916 /ORGANISM="Ceratium fusus, Strain PA161109" /LENGTH=65 /DNA_ID=CAMNT_0013578519 /DNA_START=19 /DNA_END=216 /DNA_ORIENTATION=-